MKDVLAQDMLKQLALALAFVCVRNTGIEDIHSGIEPASRRRLFRCEGRNPLWGNPLEQDVPHFERRDARLYV